MGCEGMGEGWGRGRGTLKGGLHAVVAELRHLNEGVQGGGGGGGCNDMCERAGGCNCRVVGGRWMRMG